MKRLGIDDGRFEDSRLMDQEEHYETSNAILFISRLHVPHCSNQGWLCKALFLSKVHSIETCKTILFISRLHVPHCSNQGWL